MRYGTEASPLASVLCLSSHPREPLQDMGFSTGLKALDGCRAQFSTGQRAVRTG